MACVAVVALWALALSTRRAVDLGEGDYATGEYAAWVDRSGGGRFLLVVSPYPTGFPVVSSASVDLPPSGGSTTGPAGIRGSADVTIVPWPAGGPDGLLNRNLQISGGSTALFASSEHHRPFPGVRRVDYVVTATGQLTSREVTVACWLPAVAFALMPAAWFMRHVRRRQLAPVGMCRQCGYDLRASPQRCPECGAAATPVGACATLLKA